MWRYFPGQDQVYLRWYQRWSAGYLFDASSTSLMGLRPSYGYPHFYPFVSGSGGQFAIQGQVLADRAWGSENFSQNLGQPVSFEPGRWYCVEVLVKLNTPGVADGTVAAWIDGEPKLSHGGRRFRGESAADPAPSQARINALLVAGHYGGLDPVPQLQFSWQDDLFASTQRVGCRASSPILP
jgi:hypothetical protein